jgi:hypothetical protein
MQTRKKKKKKSKLPFLPHQIQTRKLKLSDNYIDIAITLVSFFSALFPSLVNVFYLSKLSEFLIFNRLNMPR